MKIPNKISLAILSASMFLGPIVAHAATAPPLGSFAGYSVYSDAGITDVGASHVWGKVGDNGVGRGGIFALTASQVDSGIIDNGTGIAFDAFTTAYNFLASGSQTPVTPFDLAGNNTVTPGVYTIGVGSTTLDGILTLDGAGVYIFRSSSNIDVVGIGTMVLTNGATACNVFWQIPGTMTIFNAGHIEGTIIAKGGITFGIFATLVGRALAQTAITMNYNIVTEPVCASVASSGSSPSNFAPIYPLINVTKIPYPLNLPAGPGPVTYTYKVTNIGIVSVTNVSVKDNKCSPTHFVSGDANNNGILDLTETWTYNCFKTVSQTETNVVTACGSAANASSLGSVCDTAEATVAVGVPVIPPLIHVVKTPDVFILPAGGGAVTYSYAVTNPGTEPLNNVSISDDKCTGLPGRVVGHPGDINKNDLLDPGETWQFTCKTNLTQTTTNTGTATGSANGFTATDSSPVTVAVAFPRLSNTGLPPYGTSTPLDAAIVVGILMAVLASLSVIQKRRNV